MKTASYTESPTRSRLDIAGIMALIILSVMLGQFAMDAYLPSMPSITHALGTSVSTVQLTITFFLIGSAASQLIYGPFSDAYGRRRVLLFGIVIYIVSTLGCALSSSILFLITMRLIEGMGAGACLVITRSTMSDLASGSELSRLAAILLTVFAIGPAVAPTFGGYIEVSLGWHAVFAMLVLFAMIVGTLVWCFLPETNVKASPERLSVKNSIADYYKLLSCPKYRRNLLCWCLAYAGFISYLTIAPFLLQTQLGLTPVEFGWTGLMIAGGLVFGARLNSVLVRRYCMDTVTKMGIVGMILSGAIMFVLGVLGIVNVFTIIIPVFMYLLGFILVNCNAMANAFAPFKKIAGSASALFGCVPILTGALASAGIAALHLSTQVELAGILTVLGIVAWMVKPKKEMYK